MHKQSKTNSECHNKLAKTTLNYREKTQKMMPKINTKKDVHLVEAARSNKGRKGGCGFFLVTYCAL
jgi:hypothetical protein